MKKAIIILSVLAIILSVTNVYAKPDKERGDAKGQPFTAIWKAINKLQTKLDNHTHNGGSGTSGPVGPQGPRGISGAGVIAFIDGDLQATTTVHVLKTNGQVWSRTEGGAWVNANMTIPTTSSAVVQWNTNSFLDITGNVWQWTGSAWVNISQP